MKIVLSRKGFDSSNGGVASPIFPDGRLVPLPIPAKSDPHTYDEVVINGTTIGQLVEDLTGGKVSRSKSCHLDPDLDHSSLPRATGWRPAFGQIDAAQSHLSSQGVSVGDLFLFFGWFRSVERAENRWRYVRNSPNLHLIYGWLHIGMIVPLVGLKTAHEDLAAFSDHPHLHRRDRPSNTLYIASDGFDLIQGLTAGGGIFQHAAAERTLTSNDQLRRSVWRLPGWFHPDQRSVLSYHEDRSRWDLAGNECLLATVARGQEFVLRPGNTELARLWLTEIFSASSQGRT